MYGLARLGKIAARASGLLHNDILHEYLQAGRKGARYTRLARGASCMSKRLLEGWRQTQPSGMGVCQRMQKQLAFA